MAYQVLARKYRPQTICRCGRAGTRDPHAAECAGAGADCARVHFLRASRDREDDDCADSGAGAELPDGGGNAGAAGPGAVRGVRFVHGDSRRELRWTCWRSTRRPIAASTRCASCARRRGTGRRGIEYKIWILDEAHQITDAAFNALLKTLEEPPDHVIFMMATTQPEDIPQTIRSRCQHFSFHAVKFDDILTQLRTIAAQEEIDAEDAALALLAEAGDGSMRDALSIMDQAIASAPRGGRQAASGGRADSRADGLGAEHGVRAADGSRSARGRRRRWWKR